MPLPLISIPSSTTATLVVPATNNLRNNIRIQNQGNAPVYYCYDGDAAVTVAGGARPGIMLAVNEVVNLEPSYNNPMSLSNAVYVVQTSGTAQNISVVVT